MLSNFSKNNTLIGTEGRLFVDGELVASVKSVECKLTLNYEELNINGKYVSSHRYTGASISGNFTIYKDDSWVLSQLLAADPRSGIVPSFTLMTTLSDPQTGKTQTVALYDCQIEEAALGAFENGTILEEDIPFNAGDYEILSTITD